MKKFFLFSLIMFAACDKDKNTPDPVNPPVNTTYCWACTETLGTSTAQYDKCGMTEAQIKAYTDAGSHVLTGATINCVKKQ